MGRPFLDRSKLALFLAQNPPILSRDSVVLMLDSSSDYVTSTYSLMVTILLDVGRLDVELETEIEAADLFPPDSFVLNTRDFLKHYEEDTFTGYFLEKLGTQLKFFRDFSFSWVTNNPDCLRLDDMSERSDLDTVECHFQVEAKMPSGVPWPMKQYVSRSSEVVLLELFLSKRTLDAAHQACWQSGVHNFGLF